MRVQRYRSYCKYYLIFTITIVTGNAIFSQKEDSARVKVTYDLSYLSDSTKQGKTQKDLHILLIGSNSSLVYNYSTFKRDSLVKAYEVGDVDKSTPPNIKDFPKSGLLNKYVIKKLFNEKKLKVIDWIGLDKFYYEEMEEALNWDIEPDTLTILSYMCQKATCFFRGRNYIAWFTKDIPISEGPYKFQGLPGLIMRLSDDKRNYFFDCISVETLSQKIAITQLGSTLLKTTRRDFLKLQKSYFDYPYSFFENKGITVSGVDGDKLNESLRTPKPYNPIELE